MDNNIITIYIYHISLSISYHYSIAWLSNNNHYSIILLLLLVITDYYPIIIVH